MCIIVAKPAGISMPSKQTLMNCFDSNSDGAGFMFADGKEVTIMKGFFDFEEFYSTVSAIEDTTSMPIVMHFRIMTHGELNASCCHPFPVSLHDDNLSAECISDRVCVAHNGIIDIARVPMGSKISDTMSFIKHVIAPLRIMHEDFIHDQSALDIIDFCGDSKFAFLDNSMDIVLVGDFIESDGIFYSNNTFMTKHYGFSSYSSWWNEQFEDSKLEPTDSAWMRDTFGSSYGIDSFPYDACEYCSSMYDCEIEGAYCTSKREADNTVDNQIIYARCETCTEGDCETCTKFDANAKGEDAEWRAGITVNA